MGDIDGDGINDLVFVKTSGSNYVFTVLHGGTSLSQSSLGSAHTVTLANTGIGTTASFDLLDWDGSQTSAGKEIADQFLANGLTGTTTTGSYLTPPAVSKRP